MPNKIFRKMNQRGFSLIEATIGLLLIGGGVAQLWSLSSRGQQQILERNMQVQMAVVGKATKAYITTFKTSLFASVLPDFTSTYTLPLSTLVSTGFLPTDFVNKTPYDQTYSILLRREDSGDVGLDPTDKVISLILTVGGQALDDKAGARIAGGMGGAGGFIYTTNTTEAAGAYGAWKIDLTSWGGGTGAGQLAYLPTYIGGGVQSRDGAQSLDDLDDAVTNYSVGSMFVGENAGGSTSIGASSNSTVIGVDAASTGSALTDNTIIGTAAATHTPGSTSDANNTVIGAYAMRGTMTAPTYTDNNTVMGYAALGNIAASATVIRYNVAVGAYAMYGSASGSDRVAIGYESMKNPLQYAGTNGDVAIGSGALYTPQSASYPAVAIGYHALYDVGRGGATATEGQTAIGAYAAENMYGDLHGATAIGFKAMQGVSGSSTGGYNTAVGWMSMDTITTGSYNTAAGALAMSGLTMGSRNTAFGYSALRYSSSGDDNLALGAYALSATSSTPNVSRNVAIGYKAMQNPSASMADNVAVGLEALANSSGSQNVALGTQALYSSSGSDNVAAGYQSMYNIHGGSQNVAIGAEALKAFVANVCASGNVALGDSALYSVFCNASGEGSYNTGIGYNALGSVSIGSANIGIGYRAGNPDGTGTGVAVTTESRNIIIGNNIGLPAASTNDFMTIGNVIRADLSTRSVVMGGAGTELPNTSYALYVAGDVESPLYAASSDRRLKDNIKDLPSNVADKFLQLQPVRFNWKASGKPAVGFIAQDVKALFPELVSGEEGHLGVNYCGLVTPAIKTIQVQNTKFEALKASLDSREAALERLEAALREIKPSSNHEIETSTVQKRHLEAQRILDMLLKGEGASR